MGDWIFVVKHVVLGCRISDSHEVVEQQHARTKDSTVLVFLGHSG